MTLHPYRKYSHQLAKFVHSHWDGTGWQWLGWLNHRGFHSLWDQRTPQPPYCGIRLWFAGFLPRISTDTMDYYGLLWLPNACENYRYHSYHSLSHFLHQIFGSYRNHSKPSTFLWEFPWGFLPMQLVDFRGGTLCVFLRRCRRRDTGNCIWWRMVDVCFQQKWENWEKSPMAFLIFSPFICQSSSSEANRICPSRAGGGLWAFWCENGAPGNGPTVRPGSQRSAVGCSHRATFWSTMALWLVKFARDPVFLGYIQIVAF